MMTRKPYPVGVFDKVLLMIIAYALTMFAEAKRMVVVNIGLTRTSFHFPESHVVLGEDQATERLVIPYDTDPSRSNHVAA